MQKIILLSLCIIVATITACSSSSKQHMFSENQPTDIENDLDHLHTISNTQVQDTPNLSQQITTAIQSEQEAKIKQAIVKMEHFVKKFNHDLSSAQIKSAEANVLREQLIQANDIALALAKEGSITQPNTEKIEQLTQQAKQAQNNIEHTMQSLHKTIQTQTSS